MKQKIFLALLLLVSAIPIIAAQEEGAQAAGAISDFAAKVFAAAIAFTAAVVSAGFGISRAGSAGLAAAAERPEIRTIAIIIAAFAEALAIYGIVISFFILGAG